MVKIFEDCLEEVCDVSHVRCGRPGHGEILDIDEALTVEFLQNPGLRGKNPADVTIGMISRSNFCVCAGSRAWVQVQKMPNGEKYHIVELSSVADFLAQSRMECVAQNSYDDSEPMNLVSFPVRVAATA